MAASLSRGGSAAAVLADVPVGQLDPLAKLDTSALSKSMKLEASVRRAQSEAFGHVTSPAAAAGDADGGEAQRPGSEAAVGAPGGAPEASVVDLLPRDTQPLPGLAPINELHATETAATLGTVASTASLVAKVNVPREGDEHTEEVRRTLQKHLTGIDVTHVTHGGDVDEEDEDGGDSAEIAAVLAQAAHHTLEIGVGEEDKPEPTDNVAPNPSPSISPSLTRSISMTGSPSNAGAKKRIAGIQHADDADGDGIEDGAPTEATRVRLPGQSASRDLVEDVPVFQLTRRHGRVLLIMDSPGLRAQLVNALEGREANGKFECDVAEMNTRLLGVVRGRAKAVVGGAVVAPVEAILVLLDADDLAADAIKCLVALRDAGLRVPVLIVTTRPHSEMPRALAKVEQLGAVGIMPISSSTQPTYIRTRVESLLMRSRKATAVSREVARVNDVISHTHKLNSGSREALKMEEQRVVREARDREDKRQKDMELSRSIVRDGVVMKEPVFKNRSLTAVRTSSGRVLPLEKRERNRARFAAMFRVVKAVNAFRDIGRNLSSEVPDNKRMALLKMRRFVALVEERWKQRHAIAMLVPGMLARGGLARGLSAVGSLLSAGSSPKKSDLGSSGKFGRSVGVAPHGRARRPPLSPARTARDAQRSPRSDAPKQRLSSPLAKHGRGPFGPAVATATTPHRGVQSPGAASMVSTMRARRAARKTRSAKEDDGGASERHRPPPTPSAARQHRYTTGAPGTSKRRKSVASAQGGEPEASVVPDREEILARKRALQRAGKLEVHDRKPRRRAGGVDDDPEAVALRTAGQINWEEGLSHDVLQVDCKMPPFLLDLVASGSKKPVRVDHIGDVREALNSALRAANLAPVSLSGPADGIELGAETSMPATDKGPGEQDSLAFQHATDMLSRGQHMLFRGYELTINGDLQGAIALFTKAVMGEPNLASGYACRGVALEKLGDYQSALADFDLALQHRPNMAEALFNRAVVYTRLGDDAHALEDLDACLRLNGSDADALHNRGLIHRRMDNFAAAKADYLRMKTIRREEARKARSAAMLLASIEEAKVQEDRAAAESETAIALAQATPVSESLAKLRSVTGSVYDMVSHTRPDKQPVKLGDKPSETQEEDTSVFKRRSPSPSPKAADGGTSQESTPTARAKGRRRRSSLVPFHEAQAAMTLTSAQDGSDGVVSLQPSPVASAHLGGDGIPLRRTATFTVAARVAGHGESPLKAMMRKSHAAKGAYASAERLLKGPETAASSDSSDDDGDDETKPKDVVSKVIYTLSPVQIALRKPPTERTDADVVAIVRFMEGLFFFRAFPKDVQFGFARSLLYAAIDKEFTVCAQGDPSDEFYVIMSGRLAARLEMEDSKDGEQITVNTMGPGTVFGELGLIRGENRTVSCVSVEPAEVLWIEREDFFRLKLDERFIEELRARERAMRSTGIFDDLPDAEIAKLAAIALPQVFANGATIIKQGDAPDRLYVLRKGICKVYKAADREAHLLARLKAVKLKLLRVNMNAVYHHTLRPSQRTWLDTEGDPSLVPARVGRRDGLDGNDAESPRSPRRAALAKTDVLSPERLEEITAEYASLKGRRTRRQRFVSHREVASRRSDRQQSDISNVASAVAERHHRPRSAASTSAVDSYLRLDSRGSRATTGNSEGARARAQWAELKDKAWGSIAGRLHAAHSSVRRERERQGGSNALLYSMDASRMTGLAGQWMNNHAPDRAEALRQAGFRVPGEKIARPGSAPAGARSRSGSSRQRGRGPQLRRPQSSRDSFAGGPATPGAPSPSSSRGSRERGGGAPRTAHGSPVRQRPRSSAPRSGGSGGDLPRTHSGTARPKSSRGASTRRGAGAPSHAAAAGNRRGSTAFSHAVRGGRRRSSVANVAEGAVAHKNRMQAAFRAGHATWEQVRATVDDVGELLPVPQLEEQHLPRARAEDQRHVLERLAAQLEERLRRVRDAKARTASHASHAAGSNAHRERPQSGQSQARSAAPGAASVEGDAEPTSSMLVCKLFPPSVFGEMALLDPWNGKNPGTIVADTHVEVLSIGKTQFNMALATAAFLDRVRRRSVYYPPERDVLSMATEEVKWVSYKKRLISTVKKARWPSEGHQVRFNEDIEVESSLQ